MGEWGWNEEMWYRSGVFVQEEVQLTGEKESFFMEKAKCAVVWFDFCVIYLLVQGQDKCDAAIWSVFLDIQKDYLESCENREAHPAVQVQMITNRKVALIVF